MELYDLKFCCFSISTAIEEKYLLKWFATSVRDFTGSWIYQRLNLLLVVSVQTLSLAVEHFPHSSGIVVRFILSSTFLVLIRSKWSISTKLKGLSNNLKFKHFMKCFLLYTSLLGWYHWCKNQSILIKKHFLNPV